MDGSIASNCSIRANAPLKQERQNISDKEAKVDSQPGCFVTRKDQSAIVSDGQQSRYTNPVEQPTNFICPRS
jgi:hypothetical protein